MRHSILFPVRLIVNQQTMPGHVYGLLCRVLRACARATVYSVMPLFFLAYGEFFATGTRMVFLASPAGFRPRRLYSIVNVPAHCLALRVSNCLPYIEKLFIFLLSIVKPYYGDCNSIFAFSRNTANICKHCTIGHARNCAFYRHFLAIFLHYVN